MFANLTILDDKKEWIHQCIYQIDEWMYERINGTMEEDSVMRHWGRIGGEY